MDLNTPLSSLGPDVARTLNDCYRQLSLHTALLLTGMLLAAAGISLLSWALVRRRPGWIWRPASDRKFHFVYMLLLVVFLGLQLTHVSGTAGVLLFILSAGVTALAVFGLLTWRRTGFFFSLLSLWLTLPAREIPNLLLAIRDRAELGLYSVPGKIGVYAADVYLAGRAAALALVAAVLTVAAAVYYGRRRYLFRSSARWFAGISRCPGCGAPLTGDGDFCPACGGSVSGRPRSRLKWEAPDNELFCPTCGRNKHGRDFCPVCITGDDLRDLVKDAAKDNIKGAVLKYGTLILVAALVFLPLFLSSAGDYLVTGSADVNNAYTARLNQWHEDNTLSSDPAWLTEFDAAAQDLFDFDSRGFYVIPQRLNYADLYMYIQYLDASYSQMAVMQDLSRAVHEGDVSRWDLLTACFNETQNMQQRALTSTMSLLLSRTGLAGRFQSAESIVTDGVRFYLSFIPEALLTALLGLLGAGGLIGGILLLRREPDGSPFALAAPAPDMSAEEAEAQKARWTASARADRRLAAIGAAIAIVLLGGGILWESHTQPPIAYTYDSAMDDGFTVCGSSLIAWFSLCRTDPQEALDSMDDAQTLLSACREAMTYLAETEPSEVAEEGGEEIRAREIAASLLPLLDSLQGALEAGSLPEEEMVHAVSSLMLEGMQIDQDSQIQRALDSVEDLF